MKTVKFILFLFLFASSAFAEEAVTVQLKMVRPCKATVLERENDYIVTVEILPIRCFDHITNREISFRKAENIAFYALLVYLQPDKKNTALSSKGGQVFERTFKDKTCSAVCLIPKKGLKILDAAQVAKTKPSGNRDEASKVVVSSGSLLTIKDDYLETIDQFAQVLPSKFPGLPGEAKKLESYYLKFTDVEEETRSQIQNLEKTIKKEKLLLEFTEKKEVLQRLDEVKGGFQKMLEYHAGLAKLLEQNPTFKVKPHFSEAVLLSSMYNTETEGTQLIELPSGNFLLAVGIAVIPEDRETDPGLWELQKRKLLRKAELRARAEMAKAINGEQVESYEHLKETVKIVFDGTSEKVETSEEFFQKIQISGQAYLKNVDVIGDWESQNGNFVFVVVGFCDSSKRK